MNALMQDTDTTYRTVEMAHWYAKHVARTGKLDFYEVPADRFLAAVQNAFEVSARARSYLSAYELHEYRKMRCFLSADGLTMFAIKDGDELVSVCNAGERGRGHLMMLAAIAAGARRLDCFDGYLPPFYTRYGFRETAREANWTPGEPDVVFMAII